MLFVQEALQLRAAVPQTSGCALCLSVVLEDPTVLRKIFFFLNRRLLLQFTEGEVDAHTIRWGCF